MTPPRVYDHRNPPPDPRVYGFQPLVAPLRGPVLRCTVGATARAHDDTGGVTHAPR